MKTRKKLSKKKYSLTCEVREFIENKVMELGNIKRVHRLYNKDCPVDHYAREFASNLFK